MGFDSGGGGGGGGGGGMILLDQGVVSLSSSDQTYVNLGITDATRNLWANATSEDGPTGERRFERLYDPTDSEAITCIVQFSSNQGQWSIRMATESNVSGDFRWFLYQLPID
jgi:hypothetical protein